MRGLSNTCKQIYSFQLKTNPRTYTQSHTLTVVQGAGLMALPRGFDMLQYFERILPSVESLWSSLQEEVNFMRGRAAGGL